MKLETSLDTTPPLPRPPSGGRSARSAVTRATIVERSMQLFAERGYAATSIEAIARACALTKGALYWHFRNKQDLFEAILEEIRADWRREVLVRLGETDDPVARLARLFDNYVLLREARPELCQFMQRAAMDPDPHCRGRARDVYAQTAGVVASILVEARAGTTKARGGTRKGRGRHGSTADVRAAAHAILGSLTGCELQCRANESLSFADLVEELKRNTLAGLGAR